MQDTVSVCPKDIVAKSLSVMDLVLFTIPLASPGRSTPVFLPSPKLEIYLLSFSFPSSAPTFIKPTLHVSVKVNKDNNKLATEFTPIDKVIDKVFITRSYIPKVTLGDQQYVVPTEYDDTKASVPATVTVTGVNLNETEANLKVKKSLNLTAIISPQNASNQNVTWSSSDLNIATVDNAGNVTGVSNGPVTITVTTADGGYTAA